MKAFIVQTIAMLLLTGCVSVPEHRKQLDFIAVEALLSQDVGASYEVVSEIVNDNGLRALPFVKSGITGGVYRLRDKDNIAAIVHTHPFISVVVSASLGIDGRSANLRNQKPGPHDKDLVYQLGIPNYYRTPMGDAVGVLEPLGNSVVYRHVWSQSGGFRH